MPNFNTAPIWKLAPFVRLLLPFCVGILIQWYIGIGLYLIVTLLLIVLVFVIGFTFISIKNKYRLQTLEAILFFIAMIVLGLFLTHKNDESKNTNWYGKANKPNDFILVRIDEPVIEKNKSYKANAYVEGIIKNDSLIKTQGKIIVYFAKDSAAGLLNYGDKILIHKNIQTIKNSGNPGSFNYQRYASFQQLFHTIFLKEKDWVKTNERQVSWFKQFIFSAREKILDILKKNIGDNKDELGIAEALLIGYTNDLDNDLVQAYSNTGVVHVIAISGMHLGLIYVMLVWVFGKLPFIKKSKIIQVVLILSCLWLFSLLTGASASVLRSAVMFSCIAIGKNFFKQASIFNSLAASAFILLCYNPYYLWDVGFQLSYLAVIGIIIFQKPIYNTIYIKNKYVNEVWKLVAISIAAQLLTFPICIYYFHQCPNLFILTNIIAVPLSSLILYLEIAMIFLSWIPFIGTWLGKLTQWLVWLMNKIILFVNDFPFAVWDNLLASILTTLLLYVVVVTCCIWLIKKKKEYLKFSLLTLLCFVLLQSFMQWQIKNQQKLIVYNVPQHQAIDFVSGNTYKFIGDSILLVDGILQNFHLKPGRIKLQLNQRVDSLSNCFAKKNFYQFNTKKIILIDEPIAFNSLTTKINVDIILISKNPKLHIPQLASVFNCKTIVFDASNSLWKIDQWKEDCDKLNLQYYSVPDNGAYVLDL